VLCQLPGECMDVTPALVHQMDVTPALVHQMEAELYEFSTQHFDSDLYPLVAGE
jgi:hypothetical protein